MRAICTHCVIMLPMMLRKSLVFYCFSIILWVTFFLGKYRPFQEIHFSCNIGNFKQYLPHYCEFNRPKSPDVMCVPCTTTMASFWPIGRERLLPLSPINFQFQLSPYYWAVWDTPLTCPVPTERPNKSSQLEPIDCVQIARPCGTYWRAFGVVVELLCYLGGRC